MISRYANLTWGARYSAARPSNRAYGCGQPLARQFDRDQDALVRIGGFDFIEPASGRNGVLTFHHVSDMLGGNLSGDPQRIVPVGIGNVHPEQVKRVNPKLASVLVDVSDIERLHGDHPLYLQYQPNRYDLASAVGSCHTVHAMPAAKHMALAQSAMIAAPRQKLPD